ncbi:MAG: hypothetical protein ACO3G4_11205 [Opitutaceae bacterium]
MTPSPLQPGSIWNRLVNAARRLPDARDTAAPTGFATRVAALAFGRRAPRSLLDLLAWRALGVACILALSAVALNYEEAARRLAGRAGAEEPLPIGEDVVAVVLALAD